MRIPTLLQKIAEMSTQPERRTAIDIDLMLDYTRVLYADLLEWRNKLQETSPQPQTPQQPQVQPQPTISAIQRPTIQEPTLDELAAAMTEEGSDDEISNDVASKAASQNTAPFVSQMPVSQKRDIRSLIGINDKYQIMSELFGNDKGAYEQALDFINQSNSERKALDWLREQLWITEERSDAAQGFFEIVERFFSK